MTPCVTPLPPLVVAGRIRRGPAPLNLEVPEYRFLGPTKVLLG